MIYNRKTILKADIEEANKKEYYYLRLEKTHPDSCLIMLGEQLDGRVKMHKEHITKVNLLENYQDKTFRKLSGNDILVHESILKPFWINYDSNKIDSTILMVNEKLLNSLKITREDFKGAFDNGNMIKKDLIKNGFLKSDKPIN